jgi:hypothetical protein
LQSTTISSALHHLAVHTSQKTARRGSKPIFAAAFAVVFQLLIASPAFAASESAGTTTATVASKVTERDGKYYLYKNGEPLNATGYDSLDIEFPGLAEAQLDSLYGVLDANTGKLVLPFIYQSVRTETLDTIGVIEVRKDNLTNFVDRKGQPAKAPAYDLVADFNHEAGQVLAERAGKLFVLTFSGGQLFSEDAAPQYHPSIIVPPGLRPRSANPDGPLNGTYVSASYPDLKTAWTAWRKGQLIEPAQPAIVLKGDIAYVSFGILADPRLPFMRNTMGACQNKHGLVLFDTSRSEGCVSAEKPMFKFLRERDGSLKCTQCFGAMQGRWLKLPAATQSFVGIGISIAAPNSMGVLVDAVMPGAPAELAGMKPGDRITTVDGRSTSAMSLTQITDLIRGRPATSVRLAIERETQHLELNVERRAIVVEAD